MFLVLGALEKFEKNFFDKFLLTKVYVRVYGFYVYSGSILIVHKINPSFMVLFKFVKTASVIYHVSLIRVKTGTLHWTGESPVMPGSAHVKN